MLYPSLNKMEEILPLLFVSVIAPVISKTYTLCFSMNLFGWFSLTDYGNAAIVTNELK